MASVLKWIKGNYREYMLVCLLFIIGIFIGVMIVNNCNDNQRQELSSYVNDFIENLKNSKNINKMELTGVSIKNNLIFAFILWFAGTTVIGLPIVLIAIFIRGLFLGYTIATFSYTLGKFSGLLFCLISSLLSKILFIPAIFTLGVSSIKLYKSIMKNRDKQNIKMEIIRHTIILGLVLILLIISAIVENIISVTILQNLIKYF